MPQLANSYSQLLEEFSAPHLQHVGNYTLGRIIGTGSFGQVYLARHDLTNGTKVVLKATSKSDPNLAREIHHHRQFIHPHIARLYEVIVTEDKVWLVLEFCPGDELYNYLVTHSGKYSHDADGCGGLEIPKVQRIFSQLVGAVSYIHSKSCVHRDLKLENVLLDNHENVKLVDFGFTREYEGKANYLQTFCGTVCYSAPEMLRGEKYAGEKVDVWSLGVILFALLKGELPFDEDDDQLTKAKILKDELVYPDNFPEGAKALLRKLLAKRPLHRPTLADILVDPWLIEHAPAQQAILKLNQPAPFTTALEKTTLERMKAAGVDIDKVIENVLSQRCDSLAGWWALLIEKEAKKEARRERKRKEKDAEMKLLRRLSGASSRIERITPTLEDVPEEGKKLPNGTRARSTSRGRTNRRSTPQIMISDLPRLPEGSAVVSPGTTTPPTTYETEVVRRSRSSTRPPLPPKERRRRSSNLQIMITNAELQAPSNVAAKQRFGLGRRPNKRFSNQIAAFKTWFINTAKRTKSPIRNADNSEPVASNDVKNGMISTMHTSNKPQPFTNGLESSSPIGGHSRDVSGAGSTGTRGSYGATLTPITSNLSSGRPVQPRLDMQRNRHRTSLSPSPITPRSSYRRSSASQGLRGRKSTSSSVSSVRSMPRASMATHSKASSVSSGSHDASSIHSPASRSVGPGNSHHRSPHDSLKVLPATPSQNVYPANIRFSRETRNGSVFDESAPLAESGNSTSVLFARRKKSPFKGPMLNSNIFARHDSLSNPPTRSPAPFAARSREASDGRLNLGLLDAGQRRPGQRPAPPKAAVITEEDEEATEEEVAVVDDDEEDIEEVEAFPPIDIRRGESIHSIIFLNDPSAAGSPAEEREETDALRGALEKAFEGRKSMENHDDLQQAVIEEDSRPTTASHANQMKDDRSNVL